VGWEMEVKICASLHINHLWLSGNGGIIGNWHFGHPSGIGEWAIASKMGAAAFYWALRHIIGRGSISSSIATFWAFRHFSHCGISAFWAVQTRHALSLCCQKCLPAALPAAPPIYHPNPSDAIIATNPPISNFNTIIKLQHIILANILIFNLLFI